MRSLIVFAGLVLGAAGLIGTWIDRSSSARPKPEPKVKVAVATPTPSGARIVSIGRDHRGHFQANGRVDGRQVSFMVDTGASVIALTERDADRLGIRPSRGAFTAPVQTANGVVRAAPVILNSVDIGGLVVRDVKALVVSGGGLSENLLGLSYLTRLKRFEYANNKLVLEN
ncbi:TIGR02281 family clan AA aspartic protease [Pseudorhodoplanes sp.]|uniref:TIGR02281 family clan AA aspartic protease n=1 Tax=Pseudorhodoplanes sp. TaxID=1934341 RepID=UPI002CB973BC|nr:TIGR02281 family clan AA aspartic protease [Pseudorhodoplanes sp.]HWV51965.1 TIGR02281 family clan AA aspartic protease [Pseudorhodoplanes sp.]